VRTLTDFDASVLRTIEVGTYFEFVDDETGDPRVGYYDVWTERLTVLSGDERVSYSHFRCPERCVAGLLGSTYA